MILKFSKEVYGIVKDQVWTFDQTMEEDKDGDIILSFMVSDFSEVKRDILSFGEHVKVLEPVELKRMVQKSIEKMGRIYKK